MKNLQIFLIVTLIAALVSIPNSTESCPLCCARDCYHNGDARICEWNQECVEAWQRELPRRRLRELQEIGRPFMSLGFLTRWLFPRYISMAEGRWYGLRKSRYILPDIVEIEGVVSAISVDTRTLIIHNPGLRDGIHIFSNRDYLVGCNDFEKASLKGLGYGDTVTILGELHSKTSLSSNLYSLRHCLVRSE